MPPYIYIGDREPSVWKCCGDICVCVCDIPCISSSIYYYYRNTMSPFQTWHSSCMMLNFKIAIDNSENTHFSTHQKRSFTKLPLPKKRQLNKIICFNPFYIQLWILRTNPPTHTLIPVLVFLHPRLFVVMRAYMLARPSFTRHCIVVRFAYFFIVVTVTYIHKIYKYSIHLLLYSLASNSFRSFISKFLLCCSQNLLCTEYKLRLVSLQCMLWHIRFKEWLKRNCMRERTSKWANEWTNKKKTK